MILSDIQKKKLPDTPGIYIFQGKGKKMLYIGKATSLRNRVRSYFTSRIGEMRSPLIARMLEEARSVDVTETDSVLEALILEANLIKKHQPVFNSKEKSDKSFNYIIITDEKIPRVLTVRGHELKLNSKRYTRAVVFGPYPKGSQFKEAMKIIRKMFPYFDTPYPLGEVLTKAKQKHIRFNQSIGIFPGRPGGEVDRIAYRKNIRHLSLFLEGKKQKVLVELERDMRRSAQREEFEKAQEIKRKIFALTHIRDVSLIKDEYRLPEREERGFRIEAYDVAHTSGRQVVGVMTVVQDGEVDKNEYRKFKISKDANNDTAALREILIRRLAHNEWKYPRLIVVDGGKAQVNVARKTLEALGYAIPVIGIVKDEYHRPKGFEGDKTYIKEREREIILANNEAHRFAVIFHRKIRRFL